MDEILYLEPDEEITSVIDKIRQSKVNRIGLVVPRDATLLQSVVNLRLLVKEATNLGKEIALVTSDKIGRNLASKVGLTVFDSVKNPQPIFQPPPPAINREEIIEINDRQNLPVKEERPKGVQVHHFQEEGFQAKQIKPEIPSKKEKIWQPASNQTFEKKVLKEFDWRKTRKIIWPMISLVVLLCLIGAFLILPKVQVKLKVQAENYQKNTNCQVSGAEATSLENKIFSGSLVDLSKEKEEKFPATGKKNLGGKASGTITLYNNLDSSSHNFSAGDKLSSSSQTFVFKDNVQLPGATVQNLKIVPGTVNVDIEAENAGEEANVKAGRFTIIGLSASQQEAIYGQSSKELTGGFSKEVQVVSQSDYDQAKNKITTELSDDLKKELADSNQGMEILDNAIQIDIVEENSTAKVDGEAQEFTLKIKERLREIVFVRTEFDQFVLSILEKQIPSTQMLSLGPNDTISPQIKEKKYDQSLIVFDVNVSAKISQKIDTELIENNILGKSRKEVEGILNNSEGLSGFDITYFPSWWPIKRIPSYNRNLSVSLDYSEPEVNPSPSPSPSPSPTLSSSPEISPTLTPEVTP